MRRQDRPVRPPRVARALIGLRVPRRERPYVLADLDDRFLELCGTTTLRKARTWYRRQALLSWCRLTAWPDPPGGRGRWLVLADLRVAFRVLRRRPLQAAAAVATIAAGVGLTATAFSILYGTVLRGLPFPEAERLVHFERSNPVEDRLSLAVTPHDYVDWRGTQRSFEDLGAYVEAVALLGNGDAPPTRYEGVAISASSFTLLRTRPALGRIFTPADEAEGAPDVIVLGHGLWTSRFGADPGLVGRQIRVNGSPTTVIGIMPEGFGFPIAEQVWLPLRLDLSIPRETGRLDVFGRLADGVSLDDARGEFRRISVGLQQAYPVANANIEAVLRSFTEEYVGPEFIQTVYRMLTGAGLVLLLGCANVMHLLLAHMYRRREELAVRVALGASRGRLVTQLLVEAGLVATLGAAGGLLMTRLGVDWFNAAGTQAGVFALPHGPSSLFWWDVAVDGFTVLWVVLLTGAVTLGSGLIPALHGAREARLASLTGGGRGASSGRVGGFSRRLVIAEIALSTGLLVAGGFVVQSVLEVADADEAFDGAGVAVARIALPAPAHDAREGGYPTVADRIAFAERVRSAVEGSPEVEAIAMATHVPLESPTFTPFETEHSPPGGLGEARTAGVVTVTPGYFEAFRVTPLEGRVLAGSDRAGSLPVAVVNESFARRYLVDEEPIGARIRLGTVEQGDPWLTVVGIVPDLWERPRDPSQNPGVYVPMSQGDTREPALRAGRWSLRFSSLIVRGRGPAAAALDEVRAAVHGDDPGLPAVEFRAMSEVVNARLARYGIWGRFYLVFAAVGLLLAGLGIYGVLAFGVESRVADIGVRRALGATARDVSREVLAGAFRRISVGAVLGLVLGYWLSTGLSQALYRLDTADPRVPVGVVAILASLGFLASWYPARRAARVHPADSIRGSI